MSETVISTIVSGAEVQDFIERKVIPAMAGERLDIAAAAMLSVIVTNMRPEITAEELSAAVSNIAGYMVTYLSGLTEGAVVN